jgi:hypothetical protein
LHPNAPNADDVKGMLTALAEGANTTDPIRK